MNSKKAIMGLAALLILLFHFYIPLTSSPAEKAIWMAAYMGVDLFFLVSGISLGKRDRVEYGSFLKNRLLTLYLPFVILAAVCALYKHWSAERFLQVISGVEFFRRGGGAFLWFTVGILLVYLAVPVFLFVRQKLGWYGLPVMMLLPLAAAAVLQYGFSYTAIHILLMRLPVFVLGLYYSRIRDLLKGNRMLSVVILGLAGSLALLYAFGAVRRIQSPLSEIYCLTALPVSFFLMLLVDLIAEKVNRKAYLLEFIGSCTFEIYGLQMIFGFDLESKLLKALDLRALVFPLTALCLVLCGWVFGTIKNSIIKKLLRK